MIANNAEVNHLQSFSIPSELSAKWGRLRTLPHWAIKPPPNKCMIFIMMIIIWKTQLGHYLMKMWNVNFTCVIEKPRNDQYSTRSISFITVFFKFKLISIYISNISVQKSTMHFRHCLALETVLRQTEQKMAAADLVFSLCHCSADWVLTSLYKKSSLPSPRPRPLNQDPPWVRRH